MTATTRALVAYAHVVDVARSIAFYADLVFEVCNRAPAATDRPPTWAWLQSDKASLTVAQASGPVDAAQQAVLFYLYVNDIQATHATLAALGHAVGDIEH